jgi:hypothetical protein
MRFYLRFPINIHVWGGLGSQLFALALVEDLAQKFPKRSLKLVFHTGGITYRKLDIAPLLSEYKFCVKDDYVPPTIARNSGQSFNNVYSKVAQSKMLLKNLTVFLGFSSSLDSDRDFERCKPWIISVRGHYTYRVISSFSIEKIIKKAQLSGLPIPHIPSSNGVVGIQYRLGDLLDISSKGPIEPDLILKSGISLKQNHPGVRFLLFSDSLEKAVSLLNGLDPIESRNLDPWATIVALIENEFFIGTNSKISQWVVILRLHLDPNSHNLVPSRFYEEVSKALPKDVDYSGYLAI